MAYGVKNLRKMQLGRESTPGTGVAATAVWRGPAAGIVDASEHIIPEENIGYLMETDRSYTPKLAATIEFPETEVTFEQILHVFEAGIATVSPSSNGGTSNGYIYSYPFLSTANGFVLVGSNANPVKTYTIEAGDNAQGYRMLFSFVETINITGARGEALKYSHTWRGRQKATNAFTGALTPPAVEEVMFSNGTLSVDDTGGTIGATAKAGAWLGVDLSIETGWKAVWTGEGSKAFTFIKNSRPKITGSILFEYETNSGIAAEAKFAADTTQLVRMSWTGAALTGAGGTYTTKLLRFDAAVKYTSVDALDADGDGDDTVKVNFTAIQGNAGQVTPTFTVCNTLASVP